MTDFHGLNFHVAVKTIVVDNLFADVVVHQENDDTTMSAITGGTLVDGDSVISR